MEWQNSGRNSGMDITINLHIMEINALQGHVHGNLCFARERAWKFMPCKGVATIEATASVKVTALALP